ncbi:MAG: RNA 2',3'-cyclic phosphodiesterase [Chloroflexota bacterium]
MELVRAFVAIELPQEVKTLLTEIQSGLRRAGKTFVRWVSPEGVHLTLKFLGDTPADMIPKATGALEEAASGLAPFRLETAGLGVFPNPRQTRVLWIGLKGETQPLLHLQEQIETAFAPLGFLREARAFTPHLTLARLRDNATPPERQEFGEAAMCYNAAPPRAFLVDGVSLMRSTLTPSGAIYTRLALVPLKPQ